MKTRKIKHSRFFILSDRYTSSFSSDLDPIPTKESFKTLYTEQKVIFKYNQMALIASIWFFFFFSAPGHASHIDFFLRSPELSAMEVSVYHVDHHSPSIGRWSPSLNSPRARFFPSTAALEGDLVPPSEGVNVNEPETAAITGEWYWFGFMTQGC